MRSIETLSDEHCEFCRELCGGGGRFRQLYGQLLGDRIVKRTANFAVLPSLGQIVDGYMLIISNRHVTATQQLSSGEIEELNELLRGLRGASRKLLGRDPIVFEHGVPRFDTTGGCGIYHLHVHVVPCPQNTDLKAAARDVLEFSPVKSVLDARLLSPTQPYILYQDQHGETFAGTAHKLPSQYMRKLLAHELGVVPWDWRESGLEDRLVRTYRLFKGALISEAASQFRDESQKRTAWIKLDANHAI